MRSPKAFIHQQRLSFSRFNITIHCTVDHSMEVPSLMPNGLRVVESLYLRRGNEGLPQKTPLALITKPSHTLGGEPLHEIAPLLDRYLYTRQFAAAQSRQEIQELNSLLNYSSLPETVRRVYLTAPEIPSERHLARQAVFQRQVDNSVSKTINLPEEMKPKDGSQAYWRA
jgi:Ribonucleotide reductase, barrel domain